MQWYYALNNQRLGPVSLVEFQKLVEAGTVAADTLVWKEGMGDWARYGTLESVPPVPTAIAGAATNEEDTAVCVVSGRRYPKREMIAFEGKWVSAEHRDAFFQRLREGAELQGGLSGNAGYGYGGLWRRFCARFIDGIFTGVPLAILSGVLRLSVGGQFNRSNSVGLEVFLQVFGMAVAVAYEVYFLRKNNATPGKKAMGLKVVTASGEPLSTGRIIARYFAQFLSAFTLCIGYLIAAFDDEKRTLHDRICATRVVKTRP